MANKDLSAQFLESSQQTTHTYDLTILVKACAEPLTLLGKTEYRKLVHIVYQGLEIVLLWF